MEKINSPRYYTMIFFISFLLYPSLSHVQSGSKDVFADPIIRKQLTQFILETTKKTSNTFGLFKYVAGQALFVLAIPTIIHLIRSKKKTLLIDTAIFGAPKLIVEYNIPPTQDIEQFASVVSQNTFTFESVLLYESQRYLGYAFAKKLAENIQATFYSFSHIESEIKEDQQQFHHLYTWGQKLAKVGLAEESDIVSLLGMPAVSREELLVHLLKKVETRKGHPPRKVIIFFDTFDLTKIKNFKSLINTSDLSKNSRYNNVIFITATNKNEINSYGTNIQAELDRFDRKLKITKE
jgi:hypothetical protein